MVTFLKVKEIFESKGCKFEITEEEFNKTTHSIKEKYKYIASCTHEHEVWLNVFQNRNTGVKCPGCVTADNRIKTKVGTTPLIELEYHSIMYLKSIIQDYYDLKITFEGCLADVAIKPKEIEEDSWMMVQVKSTYKPTRGYSFKCTKTYKDCLVFLICDSDKKMWFFDGNDITVKDKISIGLKKSKYDENEVTKDDILESLENYYNNMKKFTFDIIDTPISDCQKIEREFRKYRENKITFLQFEYPNYQGVVFDFIVNNYKIQEKVSTTHKGKNSILFSLHKNNGKNSERKRQLTSYKKGDNDFYWFNLPDKKHFYVVPESVLIAQKYVDTPKRATFSLNPKNESWASPYLFDYDKVDIEKLKAMFV